MQNTTEKSSRSAEGLYKFFIYFVLVLLAVTHHRAGGMGVHGLHQAECRVLRQPVGTARRVLLAELVNAWNGAKMGEYMLNSVIVTALALALLLVVALPAATACPAFTSRGARC